MRSSSSLLSPPPSPHPTPLPLCPSSSSVTHCHELDLSITLSPAPKTEHTHLKPCSAKQQTDQSQQRARPRGPAARKGNTQVCFAEPGAVTVTPEPHVTLNRNALPQQPIRGQGRRRGRYHAPRECVQPPAATANQDPACLERAKLNTTLALKAELQSVQGAEFNAQKAVQETLRRSERTKNLINTRATEVVNVSRSQLLFTSLVSVEVQNDQLLSRVMQDRQLLAPSPCCQGTKTTDGPSLLLFKTPDLLRQKPLPPEDEPVNCEPCPFTRPAHTTFDLYRRRRRCEATP